MSVWLLTSNPRSLQNSSGLEVKYLSCEQRISDSEQNRRFVLETSLPNKSLKHYIYNSLHKSGQIPFLNPTPISPSQSMQIKSEKTE